MTSPALYSALSSALLHRFTPGSCLGVGRDEPFVGKVHVVNGLGALLAYEVLRSLSSRTELLDTRSGRPFLLSGPGPPQDLERGWMAKSYGTTQPLA